MERYDVDTVRDRKETFSMKWDVAENELPMWVADMDFQTAPEIHEAILLRAEQDAFGYTFVPDAWYQAYIRWWERRHHFTIRKEWMMFCTGVVAAISSMVRRLTAVGENVVILTPVYNIFVNSIVNNGRHLLECPLRYDGAGYEMDYEDLEEKLSHPETTLLIFCNPHNPIGKVWDRESLVRVGGLCKKHHVTVISDEIHCDLTMPDVAYTPFASASDICREISVTCIAPTKTFNLAGLQTSAIVVPNEALRQKVCRGINNDEVAEPNAFAVTAAIAAFEKGEPWLLALREYLSANRLYVKNFMERELPQLTLVSSEATYLLWVDCRRLQASQERFVDFLRRDTGLYLSDGAAYGGNGSRFIRINIACPLCMVKDGMERLLRGVRDYEKRQQIS